MPALLDRTWRVHGERKTALLYKAPLAYRTARAYCIHDCYIYGIRAVF